MSNLQNKTLNLIPIDYPFETLVARVQTGKLKLDPDFQRKYKWDKDGNQRCSRFIESCLMRIPLPACYFAENEDSTHFVIDGVQRITTIQRFFQNEFPLEGLSVYTELEGKRFSELGKYKSVLESTTIRCIVLRNDNSKEIVAEIFARLNQGSVILSSQEIRHAIFPGRLDSLLSELANDALVRDFKKGPHSRSSVNDSREGEELVLRFFALDSDLLDYNENMSSYLDAYMRDHKDASEAEINGLREKFYHSLSMCKNVFGDAAFRNLAKASSRRSTSLWDVQMVGMIGISSDQVVGREERIIAAFRELCSDEDFARTLTGRLVYKASILKRRTMWRSRFSMILQGD